MAFAQDGALVAAATRIPVTGPGDHVAHFYHDDGELVGQAGSYLLEGVRNGGAAIAIATPEHLRAFEARLAGAGIDVAAARADGSWLALDAATTLRRFTSGGKPDAAGFDREVGGLIRQAARTGRAIRAFGEMVALLWDAGLVTAAIELETMWNDLGRQHPFALFCGYRAASVAGEDTTGAIAEVCRLHTAVITGPPAGKARPGASGGQIRAFTASLNAPRAARRFVVAALQDSGAGHLADDAAIVVAEFAANAVLHARSGFTVTLTVQPAVVRISVRDDSPLPAAGTGPALPVAPTHGLGAVAAMAVRWGADPAGDGKEVWAELAR
jgi:DcmR-like sensory protein